MKPILEVRNISKKYKIRHENAPQYDSLRDSITNGFKNLFTWGTSKQSTEEFYALNDVSFEIMPGESVGIIGKNGAGKSTLLKILSQITPPSSGEIITRGRIASLLEVGTGFHPELSGRENVYLNGSILGLKRAEINKNFDAIVDFSGVEKFLDTPLKHYSSGMQLRLAFAVAAFLEPEILIIDEVLAVGDAEFQKKCMGKMGEVSNSGRTVLFVSHNMAAVESLTTKSIFLSKGTLSDFDTTPNVIKNYSRLQKNTKNDGDLIARTKYKGKHSKILDIKLISSDGEQKDLYSPSEEFHIYIKIETDGNPNLSFEFFLCDHNNVKIAHSSFYQFHSLKIPSIAGIHEFKIKLNSLPLASGEYTFDVATSVINLSWDHYIEAAIEFEILFSNFSNNGFDFKSSYGYGNLAHFINNYEIITIESNELK